jgi:hypothetical protein
MSTNEIYHLIKTMRIVVTFQLAAINTMRIIVDYTYDSTAVIHLPSIYSNKIITRVINEKSMCSLYFENETIDNCN